ncbi:trehalose-phosphatase [Caulobacter sp. KR2-114]|uniref:trehalose-phosphatase n=1 Tax=Caulobacter sp. KR2-114 TaxID=3400912 RepID=UPI003C0F64F1
MSRKASAGVTLPIDRAALFLDLDGTLVPGGSSPARDVAEDSVARLLLDLTGRLCGRLAVVSRRSVADVDAILLGAARCVAGRHGRQRRRADGLLVSWDLHPRLAEAAAVMQAFARAQRRLRVERKRCSVEIAYGDVPRAEAAVIEMARRLASQSELELHLGDHVAALRTPRVDKGAAVRAYMHEAPFQGFTPLYLGDGAPDELAFEEVRRRCGIGILVGPPRETRALGRIAQREEMLRWLAQAQAAGAFALKDLQ